MRQISQKTQGRATFKIQKSTIAQIKEFKKIAASNSSHHISKTGFSSGAGGASAVGGGMKVTQQPPIISSSLQYSSRGAVTSKGIPEMKASQRIGLGGPPLYKVTSPGTNIQANRNFRRST